ncbi:MAG TPA: antibiotic biosynthesis monooxygenase, partial [Acidimicrobiales bacterium]|nr:antibiotic biosynthesis monooxygenase [Acidimicrobiales bacterium]
AAVAPGADIESSAVIRVVYRWRLEPGRSTDFVRWWHEMTLRIRSGQPGAMGSTLLRAGHDDAQLVGIARWESEEQLVAFWERMSPLEFPGAVLESMEILEELDHLTLEGRR